MSPGESVVTMTARIAGIDQRIPCGYGAWVKSVMTVAKDGPTPVAACGAWTSEDTYTLMVCRYRTPFLITYDMRFAGDQLILDFEENVSLHGTARNRAVGVVQP